MQAVFKTLSQSARWSLLTGACRQALTEQGYKLERLPGKGLSNIWTREKNGRSQLVAFRTSQDRWIAFAPTKDGKEWKTLSEVDVVVLAAVDNVIDPRNIEVFEFPADEVRRRFDAAYAARVAAGNVMRDGWGMWVNLECDNRQIPISVGAGLIEDFPSVAEYPLDKRFASRGARSDAPGNDDTEATSPRPALGQVLQSVSPTTIADVMQMARQRIADLAGVRIEAVRLELKVEY